MVAASGSVIHIGDAFVRRNLRTDITIRGATLHNSETRITQKVGRWPSIMRGFWSPAPVHGVPVSAIFQCLDASLPSGVVDARRWV